LPRHRGKGAHYPKLCWSCRKGPGLAEGVLLGVEPHFSQDLPGVLAEQWRGHANGRGGGRELGREAQRLEPTFHRMLDLDHSLAMPDVLIVERLGVVVDRSG